jgi:hypothetical protein
VTRPLAWRLLHWGIVANFAAGIAYAAYMVFVVLRPPGGGIGPLGATAHGVDPAWLLVRRAYAAEAWLAIGGLAIYLALTEIAPRFWRPDASPPPR